MESAQWSVELNLILRHDVKGSLKYRISVYEYFNVKIKINKNVFICSLNLNIPDDESNVQLK